MKLKSILYQGLWYVTRSLVYAKRSIVFIFSWFGKFASTFLVLYRRTLGFAFFKAGFYARRRFFSETFRSQSPWRWLGERWILECIGFILGLVIVFPQTSWYKPDFGEISGQKTLIYALAGPGEQDFVLAEDVIEETAIIAPSDVDRWREGALIAGLQNQTIVDDGYSDDITGTTVGGALIKPIIVSTKGFSSAGVPTSEDIAQNDRSGTIQYQVQQGDVIGSIAKRHGLSVETILIANRLSSRSLIHPGDVLQIPSADGVLHTISKGETIAKIAQKYGVKVDEIIKFNPESSKTLKIGMQILVPGVKKALGTNVPVASSKPTRISPSLTIPVTTPRIGNLPVSSGGYIWPSGAKIITQYYGLRHTGVDIAGTSGLPNYAVKAGQVIKAQCGWNGGYGCYIIVDHGGGVQTLYAHNSRLLVSPGEYVAQGQVIGLLGSTGRSTGPHLHFEIRISGRRTNPLQFIHR